jgi:hypothetical protein
VSICRRKGAWIAKSSGDAVGVHWKQQLSHELGNLKTV